MSRNKPFVENLDFQEHFISTTEFQIFKIACSRNRDNCKKKKKKSQSVIWKLNFELIQLYNGGVLNWKKRILGKSEMLALTWIREEVGR